MAHNPVNHPARPIYRAMGGLCGLYLVIFGLIGLIVTVGDGLFAQEGRRLLGQGVNLAGSLLLGLLGVVVLAVTAVGRNVDVRTNKILAYALMAIGLGSLAVLRTDANILGFSVATVIVVMIIGLVLLMASMYGKVGTEEESKAWQDARMVL